MAPAASKARSDRRLFSAEGLASLLLLQTSGDGNMPLARWGEGEICVELDRRVSPHLASEARDGNRRERYLLRVDSPRPLSVDRQVWSKAVEPSGVFIAITVVLEYAKSELRWNSSPRELQVDGEARLLGYDVADDVFVSGLTDCGYDGDEAALLRPIWASQLNGWHLFDRADVAAQFRDVTEARVPEHAPFSVFGLYVLVG